MIELMHEQRRDHRSDARCDESPTRTRIEYARHSRDIAHDPDSPHTAAIAQPLRITQILPIGDIMTKFYDALNADAFDAIIRYATAHPETDISDLYNAIPIILESADDLELDDTLDYQQLLLEFFEKD